MALYFGVWYTIGFIVGCRVIKEQENKIVWKLINRGEDVYEKLSKSDVLTLIMMTLCGGLAPIFHHYAKKRFKNN